MTLVKLLIEIKSYWISKQYNTVYFDGLTKDNLIFDNQLIEEKNTRVKIHYTSSLRENLLSTLHQANSAWIIEIEIDPLNILSTKDKAGNKLPLFKTENANYHGWRLTIGIHTKTSSFDYLQRLVWKWEGLLKLIILIFIIFSDNIHSKSHQSQEILKNPKKNLLYLSEGTWNPTCKGNYFFISLFLSFLKWDTIFPNIDVEYVADLPTYAQFWSDIKKDSLVVIGKGKIVILVS